jgi:hypothetical protein
MEITLETFLELLKTLLPESTVEFTEAMKNLRDEDPNRWSAMPEEEWMEQFQIYLVRPKESINLSPQECIGSCGDCKCE